MMALVMTFMSVGFIALMAVTVILRGYALSVLWGWFVVPIFTLPAIGSAQAIGIAMTVTLVTHQYVPSKDKEVWAPIVASVLTPVFALLIGWLVKQYLP